MKDFKIALFFDDSKHNFIGCHNIPHLIPILVQTNPKLSLDNEDVKEKDFLNEIKKFNKEQKEYQTKLDKRLKRKKTKKKISKNQQLVEFSKLSDQFNKNMYNIYKDIPINFDNKSGITPEDLNFTTKLVKDGNVSAIFFDIDNTILKVNGFPFFNIKKHNNISNFSPEIITAFYLGGFQRMKKLKQLFNALYSHNTKWYFITANPASRKSELKRGTGNQILMQILFISGMLSKDKRFSKFKNQFDIVEELDLILKSKDDKKYQKIKEKLYSFIDDKIYYTTEKCSFISNMIKKENIVLFNKNEKKSKKKLNNLPIFNAKRFSSKFTY